MFHILNKNIKLQIFLLVALLTWSAFTIFTSMDFDSPEGKMMLFKLLAGAARKNVVAVRALAFLMVVVGTFGLNRHFNRQRFEEITTVMPGVFFLLLLNCGHFLDIFTPALVTIFFIAIVLMIYVPGTPPAKMKSKILTFGILIAIATLVDFSAFGIILFMVFIIATNSVSPLKDVAILLMGLVLPYVYIFSIYYLCNSMPVFVQSWRELQFTVPVRTFTFLNAVDYACIAYLVLAVAAFWIRGRNYFENKLIMLRQAFNSIHLQFISMSLFLLLGGVALMPALAYVMPSTAEYMSISIVKKRNRFVYDAIIVVLCVLLWL